MKDLQVLEQKTNCTRMGKTSARTKIGISPSALSTVIRASSTPWGCLATASSALRSYFCLAWAALGGSAFGASSSACVLSPCARSSVLPRAYRPPAFNSLLLLTGNMSLGHSLCKLANLLPRLADGPPTTQQISPWWEHAAPPPASREHPTFAFS